MSIQSCPSAIFRTSAERVWSLLVHLSEWHRWADAKIVSGPERPLAIGDVVVFRAGPGRCMNGRVRVVDVEQCRRLALEVELPFRIVNHEIIVINPVSDGACRVTFS